MPLQPHLPHPAGPRWRGPATAALAALLLLGSLPAQAQWVWRDAQGRVTASDRPPPMTVPERDILSRPPTTAAERPAAAAAASSAENGANASAGAPASADTEATPAGTAPGGPTTAPTALERDVQARRRAAEQERAARERAEAARLAAQRSENCSRARGHLATLDSGQRVARTNERGEREILDDRGRADEMRRARQVIASDCR
jgi:cytoskeletal protein RodZ